MKEERQAFILEVITEHMVTNQKQLLNLINDAGFHATQATISRDIKELSLIKKKNSDGHLCYHPPIQVMDKQMKRLAKLLHQSYKYCDNQEKMLVLYTKAGSAPAISTLLFNIYSEDVFTIMSNDDHLLIIGRSEAAMLKIKDEIETLMQQYKEEKHAAGTFHS